jgi:small-conductance mechanosensitive channel
MKRILFLLFWGLALNFVPAQDAPAEMLFVQEAAAAEAALPPGEPAGQDGGTGGIFSFLFPRDNARAEAEGSVARTEDPLRLTEEIEAEVSSESQSSNLLIRIVIAGFIVLFQIIMVRVLWYLMGLLEKKLLVYGETHFKALKIKKVNLLSKAQILNAIPLATKVLRYAIAIFMFYITIPIIFSLFALTRNLASVLFGYILNPLKRILLGIFIYIPSMITIIVVLFVAKYILRTIKFVATQIEHGKLHIRSFYPEWARPTYQIVQFIMYVFVLTVIYPYLPGSDSAIFQGISVFVGVLFSLGSTSAIGNIVAGVVITYMRPFKIGDLVKVGDFTGFVVERTAIVTRIKTFKNEYVTYPNLTVLTSNTINYKTSAENEEGLILHIEMTMGYSVPWQQVHEVLLTAARQTKYIEKTPEPFVNQRALEDFYGRYELNAFTKNVDRQPRIYSQLYENIQNGFKKAGVDLTAPHFQIRLPPFFDPNTFGQTGGGEAPGAAGPSSGTAKQKAPAKNKKQGAASA